MRVDFFRHSNVEHVDQALGKGGNVQHGALEHGDLKGNLVVEEGVFFDSLK